MLPDGAVKASRSKRATFRVLRRTCRTPQGRRDERNANIGLFTVSSTLGKYALRLNHIQLELMGPDGMRIAIIVKAAMPSLENGADNGRVCSQNYPGV